MKGTWLLGWCRVGNKRFCCPQGVLKIQQGLGEPRNSHLFLLMPLAIHTPDCFSAFVPWGGICLREKSLHSQTLIAELWLPAVPVMLNSLGMVFL